MTSAGAERITDALAYNSADLLHYFERRAQAGEAADLLAECMLTAWRRVADLPGSPEEARMWLFGIARNVLLNGERAERRRWRLANRLRLMTRPASGAGADAGHEVRDAVERLPDDLAELVRLVHWDGFSIAESAQLLDLCASTARTRYQKARALLYAALTAGSQENTPAMSGNGHGG